MELPFPKTRATLKEEILPMMANALPSFKSGKKNAVTERIGDIEDILDNVLKKLDEEKQYSGAFDYYHQTNPTSVSPNVLEQTYGRDLNFLRQYYQICSPIDQMIFQKKFEQFRSVSDCVGDNTKKKGWRVTHKQADSPNFKVTKEMEQKCRWLEKLVQNPNKI